MSIYFQVSFGSVALTLLVCTLGQIPSVAETQSCTTGFLSSVAECTRSSCNTGANQAATRLIPDMNFTCYGTITKWRAAGEIDTSPNRDTNAMLGIWRERSGQPAGTYDRIDTIELGTCGIGNIARQVSGQADSGVYECILPESLRVSVKPGDIVGVDIASNNEYRFRLHFVTDSGPTNYEFRVRDISTATLSQRRATLLEQPQISLAVVASATTTNVIMMTATEAPINIATTSTIAPTTTRSTGDLITDPSTSVSMDIQTRVPTIAQPTVTSTDDQTTATTTVTTTEDSTTDSTTTVLVMTSTDAQPTPEPTTTTSDADSTTTSTGGLDPTTIQNDTPTTTSSAAPTMDAPMDPSTTEGESSGTTVPPETASNTGDSGLVAGVVIGVVISVLLVVLIVVVLILVLLRRPSSRKYAPKDNKIIANPVYDDSIAVETPRGGPGLDGEYSTVGCDHSAMDYEDVENKPPDLPPVDRLLTWSVNDYSKTPKPTEISNYELPIRTLPKLPSSTATGNYESGILYVPSQEQRNRLSLNLNNGDIYSAIGNSQYSDSGPTPMLFEEDDTYWVPASNASELYRQLSSKKYREIIRQQVQITSHLGAGQFGTVDKGIWQSPMGALDVAVKQLQPGASEEEKVKFLQEAAINGQFRHPNVVQLIGVVTVGEPAVIVLEMLSNGDLAKFLVKQRSELKNPESTVDRSQLLRFSQHIASGMSYLAGKSFVHRDLAARNVLVSKDQICKISDFGMSRNLKNQNHYLSRGGQIPVKWTAPEAIKYMMYSTASDVWSFGCVMYEIWSLGHIPFEKHTNSDVFEMVENGYRLPPPPGLSKELYKIMIQCWQPESSQRPTFPQLVELLSRADYELFMWEEADLKGTNNPKVKEIGAPLDTAKELYQDLQRSYMTL